MFIEGRKLEVGALSEKHLEKVAQTAKVCAGRVVLRGTPEFDELYQYYGYGVEERRYPMASYDIENPHFHVVHLAVVHLPIQENCCYPDKFIAAFIL